MEMLERLFETGWGRILTERMCSFKLSGKASRGTYSWRSWASVLAVASLPPLSYISFCSAWSCMVFHLWERHSCFTELWFAFTRAVCRCEYMSVWVKTTQANLKVSGNFDCAFRVSNQKADSVLSLPKTSWGTCSHEKIGFLLEVLRRRCL